MLLLQQDDVVPHKASLSRGDVLPKWLTASVYKVPKVLIPAVSCVVLLELVVTWVVRNSVQGAVVVED